MRFSYLLIMGSTDIAQIKAYGKVNLGLDVTGRREDGYHLVRMIMQTVDIWDDVTIRVEGSGCTSPEIRITCDHPEVPVARSNLAYRAAELISRTYSLTARIHIDIRKHIPMAAGMAGGSADAAAVITGMNQCFELEMSQEDQDQIALKLGADVPFCLRRGTWLAEGIGEHLSKVPDLPRCYMVIVKPGFGVSTPWAYQELDRQADLQHGLMAHPDIDGLISALEKSNLHEIAGHMGNILEKPVISTYPEILSIKNILVSYGAAKALMSGSGPTVFGIFDNAEQADFAFSHLEGGKKYDKFKVEF